MTLSLPLPSGVPPPILNAARSLAAEEGRCGLAGLPLSAPAPAAFLGENAALSLCAEEGLLGFSTAAEGEAASACDDSSGGTTTVAAVAETSMAALLLFCLGENAALRRCAEEGLFVTGDEGGAATAAGAAVGATAAAEASAVAATAFAPLGGVKSALKRAADEGRRGAGDDDGSAAAETGALALAASSSSMRLREGLGLESWLGE